MQGGVLTLPTTLVGRCRRDRSFALQSLSKVFSCGLALEDHGHARVLTRVGVEPGDEVITDLVQGADPAEKFARILRSIRP